MAFKVGRRLVSTGNEADAALAQDRVAIVRDSILQWKLEGRCFFAQQGDAGTKLDWADTAYDEDQPMFALLVPQGCLCIPIAMNMVLEDTSGATEGHVIWSTTTNDIGNGTSTAITPVNYRRDSKFAPMCRTNSKYSENATAATGLIEVKRWYIPFAAALVTDGTNVHNRYNWTIADPSMPVLLGPATLQMHVYATGDGYHGYGFYTWVELDADSLGL